jgi:hypothetical protein
VQLVELLVQHLLDRPEVLLAVVARDLEHRLLGLLHELARRAPRWPSTLSWISYEAFSRRRSSAFSRTICA